jgi:hypothetical protein
MDVDDDAAARGRLERLFADLDRLTPDELGRIGLRPAAPEERRELRAAVDEAARRTGRGALVEEARQSAVDAVLGRYAAGGLRPTFVGLNWGLSQGTVEDRVAIAEAVSDAAAAAVVEDALDPKVAAALALDARQVVGLAAGRAAEGSLSRALDVPDDPDLGPSEAGRRLRLAAAAVVVAASVMLWTLPLATEGAIVLVAVTVAAVGALVVANRRLLGKRP